MKLDLTFLWGPAGLQILDGLVVTLKLSACALALALSIGLVVGTLRWLRIRFLEPVLASYIEVARNTPPVIQILFWYFSASFILPHPAFMALRDFGMEFGAATIALGIYHGAFFAEVVRAGLNAVPTGQLEAARILGLGARWSLPRILLPQALRFAMPPLVNETTSVIKNTSLAVAIGVTEMTYQYRAIDNFDFRGIEALIAVTVLYLLVCLASAWAGNWLSASLSRHVRASAASRLALPGRIVTGDLA